MATNSNEKTTIPLVVLNSGKLKWQGDFPLFQKFVKDLLSIEGKWTVPRGGCKQIKTNEITIRLYENQSVLVEGPLTDKYIKILERIATISQDSESHLGVGDVEDLTPPHMPSLENINKFLLNCSWPCSDDEILSGDLLETSEPGRTSTINLSDNDTLSQIEQECEENSFCPKENLLNDVAKRLDLLSQRFEKHRSESSIVLNELINACEIQNASPADTDQLTRENVLLKEQNRALEAELFGLRGDLAELNAKFTATENEKASLLTVIRMLNEEQNTSISITRENEFSHAYRKQNQSSKVRSKASIHSGNNNGVLLKNKFSTLNVEDDDEAETGDAEDAQSTSLTNQNQRHDPQRHVTCSNDNQKDPSKRNQRHQPQRHATCSKGNHEDQSKRPSHRSKIAVIGDSMVKYLNPTKLRQNLKKSVLVRTFPGAKVVDMKHYVQPTLSTSPETLVLHVGTNDLGQKSAQDVLEDLINLGQFITTDDPNLTPKVSEINAKLRQACITNNWGFISHENIGGTHLNTSGIHLNKQGTAIMAQNIKKLFKHSS